MLMVSDSNRDRAGLDICPCCWGYAVIQTAGLSAQNILKSLDKTRESFRIRVFLLCGDIITMTSKPIFTFYVM